MPLPYAGQTPFTFPVGVAQGGTGAGNAVGARTNLGLVIGTDVLAPNGSGAGLSGVALLGSANTFTLAQTISATTSSTSSTTGALIVSGGMGVAKDSWINTIRVGLGEGQVSNNTALGAGTINQNVSGARITAVGNTAGAAYTASDGTFVGADAGDSITSGAQVTIIGSSAAAFATTGARTVALGYRAGFWQVDGATGLVLTGAGNLFIGTDTRGASNSQTNSITLGDQAKSWGSNSIVIGNTSSTVCQLWGLGVNRGQLWGLTLSNNGSDATNDIDIAIGEARDSSGLVSMVLTGALAKRLDANWAAGTGNGMRNSAAAITNTAYYIWLVSKGDGSEPDIYAHTSTTASTVLTALQAETGGSAYLYLRRIGAIIRAGATILAFTQTGDCFDLVTPVQDVSVTNLTTARTTYTLASIPTGLRLRARIRWWFTNAGAGTLIVVTDLNETDAAPSGTVSPGFDQAVQITTNGIGGFSDVFTNTSAQICARSTAANTTLRIETRGWEDTRGRLGNSD